MAQKGKMFRPGSKTWNALPRFRRREGDSMEYFFAARFKKSPGIWMLWNRQEWGLLKAVQVEEEFIPSNKEARELIKSYAKATRKSGSARKGPSEEDERDNDLTDKISASLKGYAL